MAINPKAYDSALERLEDSMREARRLGMFRTAEKVHEALNIARSERFEADPATDLTVEFTIGPIREQRVVPKP